MSLIEAVCFQIKKLEDEELRKLKRVIDSEWEERKSKEAEKIRKTVMSNFLSVWPNCERESGIIQNVQIEEDRILFQITPTIKLNKVLEDFDMATDRTDRYYKPPFRVRFEKNGETCGLCIDLNCATGCTSLPANVFNFEIKNGFLVEHRQFINYTSAPIEFLELPIIRDFIKNPTKTFQNLNK